MKRDERNGVPHSDREPPGVGAHIHIWRMTDRRGMTGTDIGRLDELGHHILEVCKICELRRAISDLRTDDDGGCFREELARWWP